MGSSSITGASAGTSEGVEQKVEVAVDQRKRKRMLSNRESARRSRMRKQKHLDELASQAGDLKKDNAQIAASVNVTAQLYARVEAENSVLRAQMAELTNRLQSLNDIINCINNVPNVSFERNDVVSHHEGFANHHHQIISSPDHEHFDDDHHGGCDNNMMMMMMMNNPWNSVPMNHPIMASAHDQMCMY